MGAAPLSPLACCRGEPGQSTAEGLADLRRRLEDCVERREEPELSLVKQTLKGLLQVYLATKPAGLAGEPAEEESPGVEPAAAAAKPSGRDPSLQGKTYVEAVWRNVVGNVKVTPLMKFAPSSLQELVAIHAGALAAGAAVKAVGSGCSYSECTATTGYLITTHSLNRVACATGAGEGDPIAGQLSQSQLRAGTLPLIRMGDPVPWSDYKPQEHQALFEAEAGITIEDLVREMERADLALTNVGGGLWQTLAGYCSTSTHGTGTKHGPICDSVRSMVLVTSGEWATTGSAKARVVKAKSPLASNVYVYRIEPLNGITDPAKYTDEHITLLQSDEAFRAVTTSFGTMGVLYSLVMEVMQFFWVQKVGTKKYWSQCLRELQAVPPTPDNPIGEPPVLGNSRNAQYYRSPYTIRPYTKDSPEHWAVEQIFNIVPKPEWPSILHPSEFFEALIGYLFDEFLDFVKSRQILYDFLSVVLRAVPQLCPLFCNLYIELEEGEGTGKWYEMYDSGSSKSAGLASEWAVPLQKNKGKDAAYGSFSVWPRTPGKAGTFTMEGMVQGLEVIDSTAAAMEEYTQYLTSPTKLRFVKASDSYASMMNGCAVGMLELRMLIGSFGYDDTLSRLGYQMMRRCGARFHWGLNFSHVSGSRDLLFKMYPELEKWIEQVSKFNAQGSYTNQYTQLLGLSGRGQGPADPPSKRA